NAHHHRVDYFRVLSTFLAAIVIFLDTDAFFITNKPIVYCGNISYVLYLVHWPVIVAARYYCDTQHLSTKGVEYSHTLFANGRSTVQNSFSAVVFVVVFCLLISAAAHHSVEYTSSNNSSEFLATQSKK
ncbi:hypothetical protein COOONC_16322, partial [Cooperia oncophora]